jgi:hypothetical protein
LEDKYVDITLLTDEELEARRAKIEKKPRPLTLDRLDLEDLDKEQERRRKEAPDPRKMRGCGKQNPDYIYWQGLSAPEKFTTTDLEHCGDPFPSPEFQPPSILLCESCAKVNGLIW